MAGLLDFLGIGGRRQTGPVVPREMPRPIQSIDPDAAHAEGLAQASPAAQFLGAPQAAPQAPLSPRARGQGRGVRDFLGNLGDVLLTANGLEPMYRPEMQRRRIGDAVSGFLGAGQLGELARDDPGSAIALWQAQQEAEAERLKAQEPPKATSFERDWKFINDTYGPEAAAEFAQFGRGNVSSIPLPGGAQYVGPPTGAPGVTPWRANSAPQSRLVPQRPEGLTNEQLMAQAHQAVRAGANVEEVFRQLEAWGVNPW